MKKGISVLLGGLCVVAWAAPLWAATETVTGQVVDLVCYWRDKANTGLDHTSGQACAMGCVKWGGNPVGIVTADGKVYQFAGALVADNNTKIAPHLSHRVTVTGDVTEKDGMLMLAASAVTMAK